MLRVVRRFLSSKFHPKSRWLFSFYFSNITLRTDVLTFGVTGAVFKIAGEMRRFPAYFDNPALNPLLYVPPNTPTPEGAHLLFHETDSKFVEKLS